MAHHSSLTAQQHIELLIHILKQQGFEDVPFAVVALDGAGRAQVHASGQVKDCLDERLFASKFEEAQTLSLQRARPISSGEHAVPGPAGGSLISFSSMRFT